MSLPFLGQIALFPYAFAPRGWADCGGQLVPINQATALYSLIGTAYGGDGKTTFALPDLQGRAAVGFGVLTGGGTYSIGQKDGVESVTVTEDNMPPHHHDLTASSNQGTTNDPTGNVLARVGLRTPQGESRGRIYHGIDSPGQANVQLQGSSIVPTGGAGGAGPTQPHNNMQPSLVLRYCICIDGSWPNPS